MKDKNKRVAVCVLLLAALLAGSWYIRRSVVRSAQAKAESRKHSVAVITKSTASAFWQSVYAGARAAATEYNLELTFDGPENEEDYEAQNRMIEAAVSGGAEALVFSSVDYEANAQAIDEAAKKGVKVVVIDSDVNSQWVSSRIGTDNYRAGRMAGEAALEAEEEELRIGIVNFDRNTANGREREEGFRDAVGEDARATIVDAVNVRSTTEAALDGTEQMLWEHPEINVIVTFNEWTSLGAGYAVQKQKLGAATTVVAFDSNVISVEMLETGDVDALIVQNPFAMGYLGVESAYQLILGRQEPKKRVDTETMLVTRETMYEESCQRMLFSFD